MEMNGTELGSTMPSFDPNNNCVSEAEDDQRLDPSLATDDLVETINGRLLDEEKRKRRRRKNSGGGSDSVDDGEGSSFGSSDISEDEGASDKGENEDEPYDVEKVLISTFLEHTTSIVRNIFTTLLCLINLPDDLIY